MPFVSILLNTIDRYDVTVRCIGAALATAGCEFELLVCDNGSTDHQVIKYVAGLYPVYHRKNATNEGCAQMHNQMLLRARGDLFCLLDNDIEIRRDNWLRDLVNAYTAIPDSGVIGIHTEALCPEQHPAETICGCVVHPARPPKEDAVFGTRLFGRAVLEKVGYFCEEYGPYGLVDNEYNWRVYHSGFLNYYIDGPSGLHLCVDVSEQTPYRKMKWECMKKYGPVFTQNMQKYSILNQYYIPAPPLR